jgi:magnesium transporter
LRASWRSWTRGSWPTPRRSSPTSWPGWSSSAGRSGRCDGRSPHREVVVALAHPELDALSTERSAEKFAALESRLTQALDAARDTKDSTFGSFDLLVARIGQRTNDIMKVLTLVTVVLLPSTVLAGIMGMNFQVGLFDAVWVFWVVLAAMLGIATLVLSLARSRRWI